MQITEVKSNHLWRGEKWLALAALFLVAGIAARLLLASHPIALRIFGERVWMRLSGL